MAQFDVFDNPITGARRSYPLVVALQSDFAHTAANLLVAPLVPRASMPPVAGRLTPIVQFQETDYVLLVPMMSGVRSNDLTGRRGTIVQARAEVLAAIDHLFFGV